jgi:cytochrome c
MSLQLASALALVLAAGMPLAAAGHEAKSDQQATGQQMMGQGGMMDQGGMMGEGMLATPQLNAERGRKLFASKGCVVCHSVNGIGGEDAPPLDVSQMSPKMNPFEFAAKMWRGAEAMVMMQREELGEQIELTGQDLADIVAFAHSHSEQAKFSTEDIPERIKELMEHGDEHEHSEEGEESK